MITSDLVRQGRPALRECDTGLTGCRGAAVLPDEDLALIASMEDIAAGSSDGVDVCMRRFTACERSFDSATASGVRS